VVSPQPFYEDRGTPIAILQLLTALTSLDYQADLLTYPIGASPELPGVRYFRCANPLGFRSVPVGFSFRKLVLDAAIVVSLVERVRRDRYDVIHAVEEGAYPAALAARWLGVPLVYDMASSLPEQLGRHWFLGTRPMQRMLQTFERWLLRRAEQVVASTGLADKVAAVAPHTSVREWTFCAQPRPTMTAATTAAVRRELELSPTDRVVMYTGTFAEYQGIDLLLEAAAELCAARDDVSFVLLGGYPGEQQTVRRRVIDLGIDARVRVLGRRSRQETSLMLQIADVVTSPRRFGGNFPLKIFDYMEAGRPIVATDIPTHRMVLDERCAVLTRSSPSCLADGIARLLDDADFAADLTAAASAVAAERFGWCAFVRLVSNLYADALGSARTDAASAALPPISGAVAAGGADR
jgi:glycosyltransferase involved in cell wall biosynthesis